MKNEERKTHGQERTWLTCILTSLIRSIKTRYLDEERGNKNPTDRSVLVVRDCSWDLLLTKLFAK